jgi:hypothetical protein
MNWVIKGKPVTDEDIEGYVGFCYIITNTINGKKYIGKKLLSFSRTKPPLKGYSRKRRTKVASDWQTYYGSSKDLSEDVKKHGEANFEREIVRLCKTKSECNYWEAKLQFQYDVLLSDMWYNSWIAVKVHRNKSLS